LDSSRIGDTVAQGRTRQHRTAVKEIRATERLLSMSGRALQNARWTLVIDKPERLSDAFVASVYTPISLASEQIERHT
jgi:hypothetical protein